MNNKIIEETLAEKICNKLRDEIVSGEIPANKRLTVKEICERYGVNTMPVREAFNILCGERILKNDAFKGVTVLGLSPEYIAEIYEMQSAFEEFMLKKSFNIGYSDEIIESLEKINDELKKLSSDNLFAKERVELNFKFHTTLYKLCENTLMFEQYCKNYSFIKIARKYYKVTPDRKIKSTEEHSGIIDALKERNLPLASEWVYKHTKNACENCVKIIIESEKCNESN